MRGGAFVVWQETTGTRAQGESAATHSKLLNAEKGGALLCECQGARQN